MSEVIDGRTVYTLDDIRIVKDDRPENTAGSLIRPAKLVTENDTCIPVSDCDLTALASVISLLRTALESEVDDLLHKENPFKLTHPKSDTEAIANKHELQKQLYKFNDRNKELIRKHLTSNSDK